MRTPLDVLRLYPEHDYTLHGAFESRCGTKPDVPFLLFGRETQTWDEFRIDCEKMARLLSARRIRKGDRVAVIALNHGGHVCALFALAPGLGAIMVPINPEFRAARDGLCAEPCRGERRHRKHDHHREGTPGGRGSGGAALVRAARRQRRAGAAPAPADRCGAAGGAAQRGVMRRDLRHRLPPRHHRASQGGHAQPAQPRDGRRLSSTRVHLQPDDRCMVVLPLFHMNALFYSVAGALARRRRRRRSCQNSRRRRSGRPRSSSAPPR